MLFSCIIKEKKSEKGIDRMSLETIIKGRRTIKKFKTTAISTDTIKELLQVSAFAPNHKMTEPWEILFIGEETRAKFNHKINFGDAPILFAVLSHKGRNTLEREENAAAVSCFIQNFLLLSCEKGLGTFWSSVGASENGRNILGVSDDYDVVGVIAVGYPDETKDAKERQSIELKVKHLN